MNQRDKKIIQLLRHFRVLSRDQLGTLICPEVARPHVIVNRVVKRLAREGWLLPIPQPKDKCYLYMPNPAMIHHQSSKTSHFLGLVDVYIALKQPEVFTIEPQITEEYRPDAYTRIDGEPVIIEYQRSTISTKKMLDKVEQFVTTYKRAKHDAKTLLIVTDSPYTLKAYDGFLIIQKTLDQLV